MTLSSDEIDSRPSPIAGRWYPGDPTHLARTVDEFIARAEVPPIAGQIIGVLAPHAGHRYSGPVAGHAFKPVVGLDVDVVALIGPSHHPYNARVISTGHNAYETPLGIVPVDQITLDALAQHLPIHRVRADVEHSLEIELPFLQRALGNFLLIPLALMDQ